MKKVGIKFLQPLSYEQFESFQYLFEFEFDFDDMDDAIKDGQIIPLDMDDDDEEDYLEDLEVLHVVLIQFEREEIAYELYLWEREWRGCQLAELLDS